MGGPRWEEGCEPIAAGVPRNPGEQPTTLNRITLDSKSARKNEKLERGDGNPKKRSTAGTDPSRDWDPTRVPPGGRANFHFDPDSVSALASGGGEQPSFPNNIPVERARLGLKQP